MSPRCIYLMQVFNADDDDESGVASFTALPRTQWAKVIAPNTACFKDSISTLPTHVCIMFHVYRFTVV